jgi:hypothetical protein
MLITWTRPTRPCDVVEALNAFVGRDRNRRAQAVEPGVPVQGKGLLEQIDSAVRQRGQEPGVGLAGQALVGVHAEPHVGTGRAHLADPLEIGVFAGKFQLQGPRLTEAVGALGHGLGIIGADGVSGDARARLFQPGKGPGRAARALGVEVPEGAIQSVAGAARRQQAPQGRAIKSCLDPRPQRLDPRHHAGRVIVRMIIDA